MSTTQLICTWTTAKGDLFLLSENENYKLQLKNKQDEVVDISRDQVQDISFLQAVKADELYERYFPMITQSENGALSITFHLSGIPNSKSLNENFSQEAKTLGSFNFSFNTLEDKRLIDFSKNAPFYRRVISGLNIQGECRNETCQANRKVVYIPRGMGDFNIAKEKHQSRCPACEQKIPFEAVNNLGFWNCKYQIDGKRADLPPSTEDTEKPKEGIAELERYTTFQAGKDCAWEYLEVTTKPLSPPTKASSSSSGGCHLL
jgi:hypothetical protein